MRIVSTFYIKWKEKPKREQACIAAKIWFRKALGDAEEFNKLTTGEAGLTANSVIKKWAATKDKVREEMHDQLGNGFDNLAMAVTAKNDTIDNLVNSVSELTATNAKQNEQIIKITDRISKKHWQATKATTQLRRYQMHGPTQMDTARPVDTRWVGNTKAPIADSKRRVTNVKQPGIISWEAARRAQDLETHQMEMMVQTIRGWGI